MISKELLSAVFNKDVTKYDYETQILFYRDEHDSLIWTEFNIHELAHKVKEWAIENGIVLESSTYKSKAVCHTGARTHNNEIYYPEIFNAPTEPEAVFKAGQWVLDNKDNK